MGERGKEDELFGNDRDQLRDDESVTGEQESSGNLQVKLRTRNAICFLIAAAFCIGASVFYLGLNGPPGDGVKPLKGEQVRIAQEESITFDSFVIPLNEKSSFAYVSLSISLELPNKELREEMEDRKELLRGVIYDALEREMGRSKDIPQVSNFKILIKKTLNTALTTGELKEVYITHFLAV